MSIDATDAQLDYLERLRVELATFSADGYREAGKIWDGASPLTIGEASEAIDEFLEALDSERAKRRISGG